MGLDHLVDKADSVVDRLNMRKIFIVIALLAVVICIAAGVVRALKGQSLIAYEQVNINNEEIRITADDAIEGTGAYQRGTIVVGPGQSIVIESALEYSGIEMYITRGADTVYDQTIEGAQTIELEVEPGTYDVSTRPTDGVTGSMSISARSVSA